MRKILLSRVNRNCCYNVHVQVLLEFLEDFLLRNPSKCNRNGGFTNTSTRKPFPGSLSRHSQRIDMFNAYRSAYRVSWCMRYANNIDLPASVNIMEITRGRQSITNTSVCGALWWLCKFDSYACAVVQCLSDGQRVKYYAPRSKWALWLNEPLGSLLRSNTHFWWGFLSALINGFLRSTDSSIAIDIPRYNSRYNLIQRRSYNIYVLFLVSAIGFLDCCLQDIMRDETVSGQYIFLCHIILCSASLNNLYLT